MNAKWIVVSTNSQNSTPGPTDNMNHKRMLVAGVQFLAHGATAGVWLVDTPDVVGRKCVRKTIRLSLEMLKERCPPGRPKTAEQMWEEFTTALRSKVDQWKPLAHENVVRVLGIDESFDLRVEYLAQGTAVEYLAEHPDDSIPLRKRMIGDVLAGLSYLHSQSPPVIHGSIRMDKLFVDIQGTTKIGEFGLASLVEGFEGYAPSICQDGLIRWWSPELFQLNLESQNPVRTTASDIWALGCAIFTVMSGKLPYFENEHELRVQYEIVSNGIPGDIEDLLDPDFGTVWPLVISCWEREPERRPSIHDLQPSMRFDLETQNST